MLVSNFLVKKFQRDINEKGKLILVQMGSDNCNSYYNIDQNSGPYYQNLSSQNITSQNASMKNEWSSEPISDANSSSQTQDSESENQIRSSSESPRKNSPASSQHLVQMSAPPHQWNFSPSIGPSSYQRFYGDSHYILTSNASQHSSLHSTPSSSIHSLNSDVQNPHQNIHHMQTSQQHLKKIYYQGLKNSFHNKFIELLTSRLKIQNRFSNSFASFTISNSI